MPETWLAMAGVIGRPVSEDRDSSAGRDDGKTHQFLVLLHGSFFYTRDYSCLSQAFCRMVD